MFTRHKKVILTSLATLLFVMSLCANLQAATKDKVTIKDFYLGMTVKQIMDAFTRAGAKPSSYGAGVYNQCSNSQGNRTVNPLQKGGFHGEQNHLYDQACQLHEYDLLGSNVEVKIMLHSDQLFWVKFESHGDLLVGSNNALVSALKRKYGKPASFKYRSFFGHEQGFEWNLVDARIRLKSSVLTLESVKGMTELQRREKQQKDKIGSEL